MWKDVPHGHHQHCNAVQWFVRVPEITILVAYEAHVERLESLVVIEIGLTRSWILVARMGNRSVAIYFLFILSSVGVPCQYVCKRVCIPSKRERVCAARVHCTKFSSHRLVTATTAAEATTATAAAAATAATHQRAKPGEITKHV